jgi:REP element-mobilizing transposase RayT
MEFAGGCYHVINRGNYRQRILQKKGAADAFERTLDEAAGRFAWRIHAYVVMGNHFHLAVELAEPNLSDGMKWLQGTWVRRFNEYRSWTGRGWCMGGEAFVESMREQARDKKLFALLLQKRFKWFYMDGFSECIAFVSRVNHSQSLQT